MREVSGKKVVCKCYLKIMFNFLNLFYIKEVKRNEQEKEL